MLKFLAALSKASSRVALYASFAGMIAMTMIIAWQVFARYVLNAAPAWTEQAALLLMLWFILFAAAAGVRESFHIRLTLIDERLTASRRLVLRIFCHGVVLAFGGAMVWAGAGLIAETWSHDIPTLGLPRGVAYMPIAAAGALIVIYSIENIVLEIQGGDRERIWP